MIVDFQHHYTPPELMERGTGDGNVRLDENGNPNYRFNPLLADLPAHVRMMDKACIDVAVLSCGSGFDQPSLATCQLINDRMHQVEQDHPGRFIGLAHVPALNPYEARAELKRCAVEFGFPGVVIASEVQGQPLDAEGLRPFWKAAADLELYVFIHPPPRLMGWAYMDADDLWRMLGWEFSLMVATVRLINSGLLDELPSLKIQVSHFGGGIARYLPRIRGLQHREKSGTAQIPRHSRIPREPFDHYLQHRLFYDCAGWSGPDYAAERGAEWVRVGLAELPPAQVVFGTDYPQAVRDNDEVVAYVKAVSTLGSEAQAVLNGASAEKLIPNLSERLNRMHIDAGRSERGERTNLHQPTRLAPQARGVRAMNSIPQWRLAGDWFDICSCNIPCPCEFAQAPTNNACQGMLAWHIREGHYGTVRLDGLNLLALSAFEGNLWMDDNVKARMGFFIDERADAQQREALQMIFTGQAGGWPAGLASKIGEVRGVEFVPIAFEVADDLGFWRAEIPGRVVGRAEALSGPTTPPGKRVQTINPPGSEVGPGQVATWGRSTELRNEGFGFKWTGNNWSSKHIPFDWTGAGPA